jgi:hypothetical protein
MNIKTLMPRWAVAALAVSVLAGCDNDLFDVENPGRILDADLNTDRGVNALVTGMSADFSEGFDGEAFMIARLTDEMVGSGSYFLTGRLRRGLIDSEDADGFWGDVQRARWVAEAGLERMKEIEGYQFSGNPLTARAYLLAGFSNRRFGETFCEVIFSAPYESDDGSPQSKDVAFQRGIGHLQDAIAEGTAAGATDVVTAARGGLASLYAWTGQWDQAVSEAAQVPTDFVYNAVYSGNSGREENEIVQETHQRYEMSAFATRADTYGGGMDPRTPYTDCTDPNAGCTSGNGADGQTDHYRQEKYPELGADIPMTKGTEMRLLEAEHYLNQNDLTRAMEMINEARANYGLDPLTSDGTVGTITNDPNSMSGWDILDRERWMDTWLEGRRLWDLERWDHPFLDGGGIVYEATVDRRASCVPIADNECQVNDKATGKCFSS